MATSSEKTLLEYRVTELESAVTEIRDATRSIAESTHSIALSMQSFEANHRETKEALGRAFAAIEKHDDIIREIESKLPTLKLLERGLYGCIVGIVSLLGAEVFKLISHG